MEQCALIVWHYKSMRSPFYGNIKIFVSFIDFYIIFSNKEHYFASWKIASYDAKIDFISSTFKNLLKIVFF